MLLGFYFFFEKGIADLRVENCLPLHICIFVSTLKGRVDNKTIVKNTIWDLRILIYVYDFRVLLVNACIGEKLRKEWNFCKLDARRMIYQDFNFRNKTVYFCFERQCYLVKKKQTSMNITESHHILNWNGCMRIIKSNC